MARLFSRSKPPAQSPASAQPQSSPSQGTSTSTQGDAYYYFTMGHLDEQQYELTGEENKPNRSIVYKKALAIDPGSPVIMERLAEIYAKSQRIREAVTRRKKF